MSTQTVVGLSKGMERRMRGAEVSRAGNRVKQVADGITAATGGRHP
jgi:hypothetical protein